MALPQGAAPNSQQQQAAAAAAAAAAAGGASPAISYPHVPMMPAAAGGAPGSVQPHQMAALAAQQYMAAQGK